MANELDLCFHCDNPRAWHTANNTNHAFSLDGDLTRLKVVPPSDAESSRRNGLVLARLIGILKTKGLLSDEELARLMS